LSRLVCLVVLDGSIELIRWLAGGQAVQAASRLMVSPQLSTVDYRIIFVVFYFRKPTH